MALFINIAAHYTIKIEARYDIISQMKSGGDLSLRDQLILKSREAFIMGLEIFNKPTLKYRVEGFTFFTCNAWELLLKSEIIKKFGEDAIYYKDNINRTISIIEAIRKIFTNENDPLRKNLEKYLLNAP